jgi:hypothetical protein
MRDYRFGLLGLVASCSAGDFYEGAADSRNQKVTSNDGTADDNVEEQELPEEVQIDAIDLPHVLEGMNSCGVRNVSIRLRH